MYWRAADCACESSAGSGDIAATALAARNSRRSKSISLKNVRVSVGALARFARLPAPCRLSFSFAPLTAPRLPLPSDVPDLRRCSSAPGHRIHERDDAGLRQYSLISEFQL